jgi:secondary thiamine-phosphate synthase enzyme
MTMAHRGELRPKKVMVAECRISAITSVAPEIVATATLVINTSGPGFIEFTDDAARFVADAGAKDGALLLFVRHTSASLVIQENAEADVRVDRTTALDRLAPADAGWRHEIEGPDDMPAHIKTMLTGVSLNVPVLDGELGLGTWQGLYLAEHRARARRREIVLQFIGSRRG